MNELDRVILTYLQEQGPSFMEDVWVAVGEPWPWPAPLLVLRDQDLVVYHSYPIAKWELTFFGAALLLRENWPVNK